MSRKLFEQPEDNTPDTSMRVAFGKALNSTRNITLANLANVIKGIFTTGKSFLVPSNNFSEITDPALCRSRIAAASQTDMQTALIYRVRAFNANGNVLAISTNNNNEFRPTSQYHPVVKKYSDLYGGGVITRGSKTFQLGYTAQPRLELITLSRNLSLQNYMVVGCLVKDGGLVDSGNPVTWELVARNTDSFIIKIMKQAGLESTHIFYYMVVNMNNGSLEAGYLPTI